MAHATLLPTGSRRGHVLLWNINFVVGNVTTTTWTWDPVLPNALTTISQTLPSDIFCAGHSIDSSGQVVVAGGLQSATSIPPSETYVFDPIALTNGPSTPWTQLGNLQNQGSFYPSVVPYVGGSLFLGGTASFAPPVVGIADWQSRAVGSATWNLLGYAPSRRLEYYPRAFEISDGRIAVLNDVVVGDPYTAPAGDPQSPRGMTQFLTLPASPATTGGISTLGTFAPQNIDRFYGSAILMHRLAVNGGVDRMLCFGGSQGSADPAFVVTDPPVVHSSVHEFDPAAAGGSGVWYIKQPMKVQRTSLNAVVLPTGEVFVEGGSWTDGFLDGTPAVWNPVVVPEIYDPGLTRSSLGSTRYVRPPNPGISAPLGFPWTPRTYHSMALLLPDASVLVVGGELSYSPAIPVVPLAQSQFTAEVYSPPYFFDGLPRPRIARAPDQVRYSTAIALYQFNVDVGLSGGTAADFIDRVVLIRPGSVTHHFDNDQRYIELAFTSSGTFPAQVTLNVTSPTENLAPKGYYMLFVILKRDIPGAPKGIPSVAAFVRIA